MAADTGTTAMRVFTPLHALGTVLLFVAIGPLIGLVVFALGMSLISFGKEPIREAWWVGAFLMLYGLFFAHFLGVASAAVAGIAAVLIASSLGRAPAWIGLASGIIAFGFAWLVGAVNLSIGSALTGTQFTLDSQTQIFLVMAAVHIVAAGLTWLIVRPVRLPRT